MLKITFLPNKKNIEVNKGTTALEALGRAGINIDTPCGGKGICGKCKILVTKGIDTITSIKEKFLSVVGYLVDLRTSKGLSVLAKTNPQFIHSDNVISRIEFVQ